MVALFLLKKGAHHDLTLDLCSKEVKKLEKVKGYFVMKIRQKLVAASQYSIKCPHAMKPEFITVHNTYNDASAENEISYMVGNSNKVSYHIAVDDKEAVQGIPFERNAWHARDGVDGNGNRKSIGIEICYSKSGGSRYYKAEDNAVIIVAQLMKQFNIPISKVKTHKFWSGKDCPHRMLGEGRLDQFMAKVEKAYKGGGTGGNVEIGDYTTSTFELGDTTKVIGNVVINATDVNMRFGPATSHPVACQSKVKGDDFNVYAVDGDWLKTKYGWVYIDPTYIVFTKSKVIGDYTTSTFKPGDISKIIGNVVINATDVNMRFGAAANSEVACKSMVKGDDFNVYEVKGDWLKTKYGWVFNDPKYMVYKKL
jgi:N-acetylmuramoyl-L-alanine amidase